MSSISAQGVVERASAELSKRINGLGLRGSKHHSAKSSVMERVTNVFCGGSNAAVAAPEKPSRLLPARASKGAGANSAGPPNQRKQRPTPTYLNWDQLMMDEKFLTKFFLYFSACERCVLARVCTRWRDILYRSPRYWSGLVPVLQCREMRGCQGNERARLYASLLKREFHSLCLMGASDEDALDLVNTFPLASKHIHTLSLRCSSITDRGLESLLDHLQVSPLDVSHFDKLFLMIISNDSFCLRMKHEQAYLMLHCSVSYHYVNQSLMKTVVGDIRRYTRLQ